VNYGKDILEVVVAYAVMVTTMEHKPEYKNMLSSLQGMPSSNLDDHTAIYPLK
jgi:hypothetical protein